MRYHHKSMAEAISAGQRTIDRGGSLWLVYLTDGPRHARPVVQAQGGAQ